MGIPTKSPPGVIIGTQLVKLFGDDHAAARAFYSELEQSAPTAMYNPMRRD
jgi:hypothetical protein